MDDLRTETAHGLADGVGIEPAAEQAERGPPAPDRVTRALEHLDGVAAAAQQRRELGDRALLPTGRPVAVVQEQDHARVARQRAVVEF